MPSSVKLYGLLALGLLWIGTLGAAFWQGGLSARKEAAEARADISEAVTKTVAKGQADAAKREPEVAGKLRKAAEPVKKLENQIRETQPTCPLPPDIADGVRDAIDSANADIRASL